MSSSTKNHCNLKKIYIDELSAPQYKCLYKYLEYDWWDSSNPYRFRYIRTLSIWLIFLTMIIILFTGTILFSIKSSPCADELTFTSLLIPLLFFSGCFYKLTKNYYYPGKYNKIKKRLDRYSEISECLTK